MTNLDALAAYVKGCPITAPEQMPRPLIWNKMSEEWINSLAQRGDFWLTPFRGNPLDGFRPERVEHAQAILKLRDRLLTFGGDQACMPALETDLDAIMDRGQLWYGDRLVMGQGEPNRCHSNSARQWEDDPERYRIATGYALSKDGMWRQHSWCVETRPRKNRIVETTVAREAYFGFVLDEAESKVFCDQNW